MVWIPLLSTLVPDPDPDNDYYDYMTGNGRDKVK